MQSKWNRTGCRPWIFAAIQFALAILFLAWPLHIAGQENKPKQPEPLSAQQREELERQRQELQAQQKVVAQKIEESSDSDALQKLIAQQISLCQQEIAIAQRLDPEGGDVANRTRLVELHLEVAADYWELQDAAHALEAAQQARHVSERLLPREQYPDGHALIARSYFHVGRAAWLSKNLAESEQWHDAGLKMRRKLFSSGESPQGQLELGESLHWLGTIRDDRGAPEEGKKSLLEAVEIFRKYRDQVSNDKSVDKDQLIRDAGDWYDDTLRRLGMICTKQGEYDAAIGWYEKLSELMTQTYEVDKVMTVRRRVAASERELAGLYYLKGNFQEAARYAKSAVDWAEPSSQQLVVCLNDLVAFEQFAGNFNSAKQNAERVLELQRQLYPVEKYPDGVSALAVSLSRYGTILNGLGDIKGARRYLELGVEMRRKLLAREPNPENLRFLAISVSAMAEFLMRIGDGPMATRYYEEAVQLFREVYPKDRFPAGHPELASGFFHLALVQLVGGEYAAAAENGQRGADMNEALVAANIPVDRRAWATGLSQLGEIYDELNKPAEAIRCHQKALDLYQAIYPTSRYPHGHQDQSLCLQRFAKSCVKQKKYKEAVEYSDRSVEIGRHFYSAKTFPHGNTDLTSLLYFNALTRYALEDYAGAALADSQGIRMDQELAEYVLPGLSEAESLNYVNRHLVLRSVLFATWDKAQRDPEELYDIVWNRRSLVMRLLQQRNLAIRSAVSPQTEQAYREFEQASRALGKALAGGAPAERLAQLTAQKEAKELAMVESIPGSQKLVNQQGRSFRELLQQLPPDCAYVEIAGSERSSGPSAKYCAFVLTAGRTPVFVSLGEAKAIDSAVAAFRTAIAEGRSVTTEAKALRELVWAPIEKTFPTGIGTVFLCPVGSLTAVPWSMLPGRGEQRVLLEDYAVAMVPSGHVLLEQLLESPRNAQEPGSALVVGDLAFDARISVSPAPASQPMLRSVVRGEEPLHWNPLPGTARELEGIMTLKQDRPISALRGQEAPVSRVLQELPRVRWAHFATHGYFADAQFHALSSSPASTSQRANRRSSAAARNPQLLSGIVLSGANKAHESAGTESEQNEAGILTAEAISMLPLERLQLVVLSACETGVGDVADGEGVLGLQRAFHMAGTRNVVASLWKVDDRATAVLMKLFYEHYWKQGKPPIVALREAQLMLYRNPGLIENDDERARGITVTKSETVKKEGARATTDPRLWAAFTLSGRGD